MARRDAGPDFIEAPARGLDVIQAFQLPLLHGAGAISADWAACQAAPCITVRPAASLAPAAVPGLASVPEPAF